MCKSVDECFSSSKISVVLSWRHGSAGWAKWKYFLNDYESKLDKVKVKIGVFNCDEINAVGLLVVCAKTYTTS